VSTETQRYSAAEVHARRETIERELADLRTMLPTAQRDDASDLLAGRKATASASLRAKILHLEDLLAGLGAIVRDIEPAELIAERDRLKAEHAADQPIARAIRERAMNARPMVAYAGNGSGTGTTIAHPEAAEGLEEWRAWEEQMAKSNARLKRIETIERRLRDLSV